MSPQHQSIGDRKTISIDEIVALRKYRPAVTNRDRGWPGITVDIYGSLRNCSEHFAGLDHHMICYWTSGGTRFVQGRDGKVHENTLSASTCLLMPAGYDSTWEGDATGSVRLRVPIPLITAAAEQLGRRKANPVEILNVFETRDPVFEHLALMFQLELKHKPHPAQYVIVEGLSNALAAHLVRRYNVFDAFEEYEAPALGRKDIARVSEYIEEKLDSAIGLAELAAIVNVSRFHFARLFKRSTGVTAMYFVEQCRIRRAQALIEETDFPLAEIALMVGFADQSHFTNRFQRHIGCTPAVFARENGRRRQGRRQSG